MKFLALLASLPSESDRILASMTNVRTTKIAGKTVYRGQYSGLNLLLLNTGIGKVNAAHSATGINEHFPIRYIINFGVAGAYPESGLKKGDIAIASQEIFGDEGILASNGRSRSATIFRGMQEIGIPFVQAGNKKYYNKFPLDRSFLKKVVKSFNLISCPSSIVTRIKSGNFVTVSAVSGTIKRATELEKRFNAICENMEGAAIAHVCSIYKIPMLEIRGISNIAGERDRRKWKLKLASENCQKAVLKAISSLV